MATEAADDLDGVPLRIAHIQLDSTAADPVCEELTARGAPCDVRHIDARSDLGALLAAEPVDAIVADHEILPPGERTPLDVARSVCPDTPFLYRGGSIGEDLAAEAVLAGAAGYLLKSRLSALWPTLRKVVAAARRRADERRAEEARRIRLNRYQLLVETCREGIWVIDLEGKTTYANHRMGEILGLDAAEMLGRSMFDFMDDKGRAISAENLERRRRGLAEQHEFLFRRSEGSDVWTLINTSPFLDAAGNAVEVLGMITDITDLKQTEQKLSEKLAVIEKQRSELQMLSSPVIEVWDGVLCLPVVSSVDSVRAAAMLESLLDAVTRGRARFAIIDLTGVESIDSAAADHFVKIVAAVRLIGAESIITGLRPAVAQAIVALGVDLPGVATLPNLKAGLRLCMRRMDLL
jgi:rsbT co-antagonist protein RsbR